LKDNTDKILGVGFAEIAAFSRKDAYAIQMFSILLDLASKNKITTQGWLLLKKEIFKLLSPYNI